MSSQNPYLNKSSRDAYGIALYESAKKDDRIVALTADVPESVRFTKFRETWPGRFFNFGIAEQNMMGAAAGLARSGKIPYVSVYAIFAALRSIEQLRTDIAYPNLPVRICVSHSGISLGPAGPSHHSIEDISVLRSIPNMTVIAPADGTSTAMALDAIQEHQGPVYLRLNRAVESTVYPVISSYEYGKSKLIREGKDLTIIAYGASVGFGLQAADELSKKGVESNVVDMAFIKPIDREMIIETGSQTGRILTVEEQTIIGGLGSAVAEVIAEEAINVKLKRLGIPDEFTLAGPYPDLQSYYSLDTRGIVKAALDILR